MSNSQAITAKQFTFSDNFFLIGFRFVESFRSDIVCLGTVIPFVNGLLVHFSDHTRVFLTPILPQTTDDTSTVITLLLVSVLRRLELTGNTS